MQCIPKKTETVKNYTCPLSDLDDSIKRKLKNINIHVLLIKVTLHNEMYKVGI